MNTYPTRRTRFALVTSLLLAAVATVNAPVAVAKPKAPAAKPLDITQPADTLSK
jgi:hypothetical protein